MSQKRPKTGGKLPSSLHLPQSRKRSHDGSLLADQDDQEEISKQTSPAASSLGSLFESAHSRQDSDDDDEDDENRESATKAITISDDGQGSRSGDEGDPTPTRNSNENGSVVARESNENGTISVRNSNENESLGAEEADGNLSAALGEAEEANSQDAARQERERQEKELQERERRERERQDRAKVQLVTALMQITELSSGTFATHGHLPNAINPGLNVISLGGIGLPLSLLDAQRLKTVSRRLPSARINSTAAAATTVVTGSIWEMYPNQFVLRNPSWSQFLNETLTKVAPALGISPDGSGVRPDLQRLFLYEQGAFTDLRKDPPQPPNVFGTLVIVLPSMHTGGAVAAVSGENIQLLAASPNAEFDTSYLAWHTNEHTNVEHALQEVTSGHRIVLKYNLLYADEARRREAQSTLERRRAVPLALRALQPATPDDRTGLSWPLAFILEYKYPDLNFQQSHLIRSDAVRTTVLQQACKAEGFALCLANTAYTITGSCTRQYTNLSDGQVAGGITEKTMHHKIINEYGRNFKLSSITLLNGRECTKNLNFKESNVLQPKWYANRTPDKEDFHVGETSTATHWFRNSCLLILPLNRFEDFLLDIMARSPGQAEKLLLALVEEIEEAKPNAKKRRGRKRLGIGVEMDIPVGSPQSRLQRLCKILFYNSWFSESLVLAAIAMDDHALIHAIATCPGFVLSERVFHTIGLALPFGLTDANRWKESVVVLARKAGKVSEAWKALSAMKAGYLKGLIDKKNEIGVMPIVDDASIDAVTKWVDFEYDMCLKLLPPIDHYDAQALIDTSIQLNNREEFLNRIVLPFVKRHVKLTTFALSFLHRLCTASENGSIRTEFAIDLYRTLFSSLLPELLKSIDARIQPALAQHSNGHPIVQPDASKRSEIYISGPQADFSTPDQLFTLCQQCLRLGLEEELRIVFDELARRSDKGPTELLHAFHVPLLIALLAALTALPDEKLTRYRLPVQTIFDNYIQRYVGAKPEVREDWSDMEALGCDECEPCKELDKFLLDPEQTTGRFAYDDATHIHLCQRLPHQMYTSVRWVDNETSDTEGAYTLVIEKRTDEAKVRHAQKVYSSRRRQALSLIQSFNRAFLSRLLGVHVDELTAFYPLSEQSEDEKAAREDAARDAALRAEAARQQSSLQFPARGPGPNPVIIGTISGVPGANVAEDRVVDLTSDSPRPLSKPMAPEETHHAWSYLHEKDPVKRLEGACKVHSYTHEWSITPSPWAGGQTGSYHGHLLLKDYQGKTATAVRADGEQPFRTEWEVKGWLAEKACKQMFEKKKP